VSAGLLRRGFDGLRYGPWRGHDGIAYLAPTAGEPQPAAATVRRVCEQIAGAGYRRVITAALDANEAGAFLAAGFGVREQLLVLSRGLGELPIAGDVPLRRARRGDRLAVLEIDRLAFPTFWQLDQGGLAEALAATPSARFRVGHEPPTGRVVAYAIWGRAGRRGYLQRLAVDPAVQRTGYGTGLVVDGLRWLRRHGGEVAVVNTQLENREAIALYERLGFEAQPTGLVVLETDLTP
jgi:ribosomal protein S18 acetylase RimI-like enzyme